MSAAEVVSRAGDAARRRTARGRLEGWDRYKPTSDRLPGLALFSSRTASSATSRQADAIAAEAAAILNGEFEALGVAWPKRTPDDLFPATCWRLDPVTGGAWPPAEQYCFDIPYRHERVLGDIKYVWEFNRLQFLQPLAAHFALTRDPAALKAVDTAIVSWYEANPPFRGIAWNSGIELALRSISLIIAASLCAEALPAETIRKLKSILLANAFWMRRFPSRFSSANNHLIAEAAGEYLIGLAMPDEPHAARLCEPARRVLETEAAKQILADGVPAEQSPTYGAFSSEFLLLCTLAGAGGPWALHPSVLERLCCFSDWIRWMSDRDGSVPAIGDDDEGRVIAALGPEDRYAAHIASLIDGSAARPAAPRGDGEGAQLRDWLLDTGDIVSGEQPSGVKTFRDGGYSVVCEARAGRRLKLVFDHGPLGYLSIAAHGHADALSIWLSIDDQPILVDGGTYLYHSGAGWRDYFRGTRAHNTVRLGERDQSDISGAFNWSRRAHARLEQQEAANGVWSLSGVHDGYQAPFSTTHRRTLASEPSGFSVTDQLDGLSPEIPVEFNLLFDPSLSVKIDPSAAAVVSAPDGKVILTVVGDPSGDFEIVSGAEDPIGGWISPAFGKKAPAPLLCWRPRGAVTTIRTEFRLA